MTARPRNIAVTSAGKQRAVCQFCGKQSRAHERVNIFVLGAGWSVAPYPADFVHTDGSLGSMFTCPTCNTRRTFPRSLKLDR